jgi:hypothetical protein
MKASIPQEHSLAPSLAGRDGGQPEWDIYLLFDAGVEWKERAPGPSRWLRQTALLPSDAGGPPRSVLWADDYGNAPTEGILAEHLSRLVSQGPPQSAMR